MTKHDFLDYLNYRGSATANEIAEHFFIAYITAYTHIRRLHSQGLIKIYGKDGRNNLYELTQKGTERLDYFNNGHCPNIECTCRET